MIITKGHLIGHSVSMTRMVVLTLIEVFKDFKHSEKNFFFLTKHHFYKNQSIDMDRIAVGSKRVYSVSSTQFLKFAKQLQILCLC